MTEKRFKRSSSSKSLILGSDSKDSKAINRRDIDNIIFELKDVESLTIRYVNKMSAISPIDRDKFLIDVINLFHSHKSVPVMIEHRCSVCSTFMPEPNHNNLCGNTYCAKSIITSRI